MRARWGAGAILILALTPSAARAVVAVSSAGEFAPIAVAQEGGSLMYLNLDTAPHNIVARATRATPDRPFCSDYPADACPLFWTPLLEYASAAAVEGLEDARAGAYGFFCELHPGMTGTLTVL